MNQETSGENDFFSRSREELKQYFQDRLLLAKMQATDKGSRIIAVLVLGMMGALLGNFVLLFLSLVAGFVLSALTGNFYVGFGIIAFFYVLLTMLFFYKRKKMMQLLTDLIIRIVFDPRDEEGPTNDH